MDSIKKMSAGMSKSIKSMSLGKNVNFVHVILTLIFIAIIINLIMNWPSVKEGLANLSDAVSSCVEDNSYPKIFEKTEYVLQPTADGTVIAVKA